jgi:hypothetical protein
MKDALRSVKGVVLPLIEEIEGEDEMLKVREENEYIDESEVFTPRIRIEFTHKEMSIRDRYQHTGNCTTKSYKNYVR